MSEADVIVHNFLKNFELDFFCNAQGTSENEPDENKIQRHILDCIGAVIKLKLKNETLTVKGFLCGCIVYG
jgi:hypothetical protein